MDGKGLMGERVLSYGSPTLSIPNLSLRSLWSLMLGLFPMVANKGISGKATIRPNRE